MAIPFDLEYAKLWIAMIAVILIITYELVSPLLGTQNLYIQRKRLRNVTYVFVAIFLFAFIISLYISVFV